MPNTKIEPLRYDPSGVLSAYGSSFSQGLNTLVPSLDAARTEVVAEAASWQRGETPPPLKTPLDAGFIDLPERLLADYNGPKRAESELHKVIAAARRLAESVDRAVVLGIGGSYMGARALFEAGCHPYWNELSRGARHGCPRLYFEGNNLDNDAMQGLLDLLTRDAGIGAAGSGGDDAATRRWGIVVISKSGGTLETAIAFRTLLSALEKSGGDVKSLVVPVTDLGRNEKENDYKSLLYRLTSELGCRDTFEVPDGVGGRFSVFTAVGLLPAALLGLDVVKLLEGAAAMNRHFREALVEENVVLRYVGVGHLAETRHGATIRAMSTWGKSLEAVGLWYDQLLSESLGKNGRGATPLTVVNTRDLHSRGQQHQDGRPDKLITNLIVDGVRQDRLTVESRASDRDKLNWLAGKTIPEALDAATKGTNLAYNSVSRPTADLILAQTEEASIGQLLQMLMLATVVEGRLIGVNPYGQPGVEDYKRNMKQLLQD
ncbi:MAG: glucose-6-phosphate isomerase [Pirellulales bacterium]